MVKFRLIFFDYNPGYENIVTVFIDDVIERIRTVDYRNKCIRISENTLLIRITNDDYPYIDNDYLLEIKESNEFYKDGFFQLSDISIYKFIVDSEYIKNNISGFSNEIEYLTNLK